MAVIEQGLDGVRVQVDDDAGDAVLGQAFMQPPAYGAVAADDGVVLDSLHARDHGFHAEAFPFCLQARNAHQQGGELPRRLHQQGRHAHGDGGNGVHIGGHQRRNGGDFLHEGDEHQGEFPYVGQRGGGHDAHAAGDFQEACGHDAGHEFDREDKGGEGRHMADVLPQVVNVNQQPGGNEEDGQEKVLEGEHFTEDAVAVVGAADEKPGGEGPQRNAQAQQAGEHGDAGTDGEDHQGEELPALGPGHGQHDAREQVVADQPCGPQEAVSYTHLTLPTIAEV